MDLLSMTKKTMGLLAIVPILMLFPLFTHLSIAEPDPFMGEGKEGYINRCIKNGDFPNISHLEVKQLCRCFATKLENGYAASLKRIKATDTISESQSKLDNSAKGYFNECLNSIKK